MRITSKQLKQIVKEEVEVLLLEINFDGKTGFPLNQKAAKMVQKRGDEDALYGKYKKPIDALASGKIQDEEMIQRMAAAIRKKEGIPPESSKSSVVPKGQQTGGVESELYKQRDFDDLRADPEPETKESTQQMVKSVTSQLIKILPQLPPDLEKQVEPKFGKFIEFLTKVSIAVSNQKQ